MPKFKDVDLGIVKSESSTKDSNLFHFPIPQQDSDSAILIDLMGVSRNITITGEKTGTKEQVKSFIETIEGIQDGKQESANYDGELITGIKCQIQSFDWEYSEGTPGRVTYSLTLMEGDL